MAAEQDPVSWLLGNREIMVGVFMLIAWVVRMTGLSKEKQKSATQTKQSTSGIVKNLNVHAACKMKCGAK